MQKIILIFRREAQNKHVSTKDNYKIISISRREIKIIMTLSKLSKVLNTAKVLALTLSVSATIINNPVTVNAKSNNVRYTTGIVTGAKSITTSDGNVWRTKRKLHLRKGTNVSVKFDTKGTKRKKDDAILKVSKVPKAKQAKPEISIPISDIALVYTDSLGYTTLQLKDYGCVADDPNGISYETIKQMVNSYYASVRETENSVTVTEFNGNTWTIRK